MNNKTGRPQSPGKLLPRSSLLNMLGVSTLFESHGGGVFYIRLKCTGEQGINQYNCATHPNFMEYDGVKGEISTITRRRAVRRYLCRFASLKITVQHERSYVPV